MRNFDSDSRPVPLSDEDMRFTLRDETFTRRDKVRPEAIATIEDSAYEPSSLGVIEMMDRGILEYLVPEDADRWNAVRGKDWLDDADDPYAELRDAGCRNPVQLHELQAIGKWLVEVETRLPTTRPSASTDGPNSTGPSSTDASSSEEEIRAA
jgi:hypothetical protein